MLRSWRLSRLLRRRVHTPGTSCHLRHQPIIEANTPGRRSIRPHTCAHTRNPLCSKGKVSARCVGRQKRRQNRKYPATPWKRPCSGGEGGIRTHSMVTRTMVFEFYDSHVGPCRPVANRVL